MILLLASLSTAEAGGYFFSDSGVIATGRGGAWIAGANHAMAQRYNPAGLIRVKHFEISGGLSGVRQDVTFTRTGTDGSPLEPTNNGGLAYPVPELGLAGPLGPRFAWAFGFTSPFAPTNDFPADGSQRYTVIDTSMWKFSVGPSLAWRASDWLTLGATVSADVLRVEQHLKVTTLGLDDPSNDVDVQAKVADWFTPGFVFGALIEPHKQVSIGFSATAQQRHGAKGTGAIDLSESTFAAFVDPDQYSDDITLNQVLPWELRTGIAVRPIPKLEIEAAYVWQDWSKVTEILIEDIDVEINSLLGPQKVPEQIALPAGLRDTHSFRLGAEWDAHEMLALRVGGFYETGSSTPQKLSAALVDPWKVQAGGGATVRLFDQRLQLDVAAAGVFLPTVDVDDSQVTLINVLCEDPSDCDQAVVGNGRYQSSGLLFGGNLRWQFSGKKAAKKAVVKPRASTRQAE